MGIIWSSRPQYRYYQYCIYTILDVPVSCIYNTGIPESLIYTQYQKLQYSLSNNTGNISIVKHTILETLVSGKLTRQSLILTVNHSSLYLPLVLVSAQSCQITLPIYISNSKGPCKIFWHYRAFASYVMYSRNDVWVWIIFNSFSIM